MSVRVHISALRSELLDDAHAGNGTGCRCCRVVDDGILAALLDAVEAARVVAPILPNNATLNKALDRFDFGEGE